MENSTQSGKDDGKSSGDMADKPKAGISGQTRKEQNSQSQKNSEQGEVLLKLPGGFKYQLPGKRQRVILGSVVIGLNVLLVLAVILYFYSPDFQDFVYNFGR
tara:strand:+ start:262 stop:567 length:306 start_codon:yes stop_codon:yes gene_type:complete